MIDNKYGKLGRRHWYVSRDCMSVDPILVLPIRQAEYRVRREWDVFTSSGSHKAEAKKAKRLQSGSEAPHWSIHQTLPICLSGFVRGSLKSFRQPTCRRGAAIDLPRTAISPYIVEHQHRSQTCCPLGPRLLIIVLVSQIMAVAACLIREQF